MEIKEAIKQIVKSEKSFSFLSEIISENSVSENDSKVLKYYAKTKLKSLLDIAKLGNEFTYNDILSLLINLWFEWRSEWIRCNAINNYNMVFYGAADILCVIKAAYVSHLLSKIEPLIPNETLQKIHEIMVNIQYQT